MVKLRGIVTAALVATMAVGSIAAPAAADPSSGTAAGAGFESLAANKPLIEITGHMPGVGVQVVTVIRCYGGISPVLLDGFFVHVTAAAVCDHPITDLSITVELYRVGNLTGTPGFDSGTSSVGAGAHSVCIDGGYYGKMIVNMLFPTGFRPPSARAERFSGAVNIDCP